MKADEFTTLLLYGYTMFEKSGTPAFNEISNKLRNVARLIIIYRNIKKDTCGCPFELVDTPNWYDMISCCKNIGET